MNIHPDFLELNTASYDYQAVLKQQDLEQMLGLEERMMCAPTAIYGLALRMGYNIPIENYLEGIDRQKDYIEAIKGWSRPGLTYMMRKQWGAEIVSCWTSAIGHDATDESIAGMQKAGYLSESDIEIEFYQNVVCTAAQGANGVLELVRDKGIPLVTTVDPGFGENKAKHAIAIDAYDQGTETFEISDPDERNSKTRYTREELLPYIANDGATTIILPITL